MSGRTSQPVQAGDTIGAARRAIIQALDAHAIDTPDLDARFILCDILALDLTGLVRESARPLTDHDAGRINTYVLRRIAHEPLARIIGHTPFWNLDLIVTPHTLVPRSDTETLVRAACDVFAARRAQPLRIADLGTGTGAIALALLQEFPHAACWATDIDPDTLAVARRNAARNALGGRIEFVTSDYAAGLSGPFDMIVSNPPYIVHDIIPSLAPDVRDYDPHLALDGGADGLDAYRAIIGQAPALLAAGGWLLLEVGHDQAEAVARLMAASGLTIGGAKWHDSGGVERVVAGHRAAIMPG